MYEDWKPSTREWKSTPSIFDESISRPKTEFEIAIDRASAFNASEIIRIFNFDEEVNCDKPRRGKDRLREALVDGRFEDYCDSDKLVAIASPIDALRICKESISLSPNSALAHLYMGKVEMQSAAVFENYRWMLDGRTLSSTDSKYIRDTIYSSKYSALAYTWAIDEFDQAIKLAPKNSYAYLDKSCALLSLVSTRRLSDANVRDACEEALEASLCAIDLSPNYAEAYNNKGYALYKLGRYVEALAAYDKAISLDLKSITVYLNKYDLLDVGRYFGNRRFEREETYSRGHRVANANWRVKTGIIYRSMGPWTYPSEVGLRAENKRENKQGGYQNPDYMVWSKERQAILDRQNQSK